MAVKDKAASALARLHAKALAMGESYQQTLLLFCQEELLRRVAFSPYANKLVLKGGLFLYLALKYSGRTTMDTDFLLRHHGNDENGIRAMLEEIIATPTENDFIDIELLNLKPIALQQHYHGMQASLVAHIKRVRISLFIDFGIGDVIVPAPETRSLVPLLPENSTPRILTYSLESTIAEKYDAIVLRMEQTSRMKDFFDIYTLSKSFPFKGSILQQALRQTMENRGTRHDANTFPHVEKMALMPDMLKKWEFFNRSMGAAAIPFDEVIQQLCRFLKPVATSLDKGDTFALAWTPEHGWH